MLLGQDQVFYLKKKKELVPGKNPLPPTAHVRSETILTILPPAGLWSRLMAPNLQESQYTSAAVDVHGADGWRRPGRLGAPALVLLESCMKPHLYASVTIFATVTMDLYPRPS